MQWKWPWQRWLLWKCLEQLGTTYLSLFLPSPGLTPSPILLYCLDVSLYYWMSLASPIQFPWWLCGKESAHQCRIWCRIRGLDSWVRKIPLKRKRQPTPAFVPGKSHGKRSLVGYRPWGHKESGTSWWLNNKSKNQSLPSPVSAANSGSTAKESSTRTNDDRVL